VERGTLRLTINGTPYTLHGDDSIYYDGDCWHGLYQPGRRAVRLGMPPVGFSACMWGAVVLRISGIRSKDSIGHAQPYKT